MRWLSNAYNRVCAWAFVAAGVKTLHATCLAAHCLAKYAAVQLFSHASRRISFTSKESEIREFLWTDGILKNKVWRCKAVDRSWGPCSFLYNGYRVSLLGVKRPERVVNHPPPSSAEIKERVELYLYSVSAFMACPTANVLCIKQYSPILLRNLFPPNPPLSTFLPTKIWKRQTLLAYFSYSCRSSESTSPSFSVPFSCCFFSFW